MHNCQFKYLQAEPSLSYRFGHKAKLLDTHSCTTSAAVPSCCLQMTGGNILYVRLRWWEMQVKYLKTERLHKYSTSTYGVLSLVEWQHSGVWCLGHRLCGALGQQIYLPCFPSACWALPAEDGITSTSQKKETEQNSCDQCLWKVYHLFKSRIMRKSTTVFEYRHIYG